MPASSPSVAAPWRSTASCFSLGLLASSFCFVDELVERADRFEQIGHGAAGVEIVVHRFEKLLAMSGDLLEHRVAAGGEFARGAPRRAA